MQAYQLIPGAEPLQEFSINSGDVFIEDNSEVTPSILNASDEYEEYDVESETVEVDTEEFEDSNGDYGEVETETVEVDSEEVEESSDGSNVEVVTETVEVESEEVYDEDGNEVEIESETVEIEREEYE